MAAQNLISILIAAKDEASKVIEGAAAKTKVASAEANSSLGSTATTADATGKMFTKMGLAVAAAAVVSVGIAIKAAGDYQSALVRLTTSAGESTSNLKLVGDGMLSLARDTGTSTKKLTDAMYLIESAGLHGADGLTVLKAAAQGAKAENANVATVADAVSSVLQDYHLKASDAALVTSKLVVAIGDGKTNFEAFAGSLSSVLPIASAAHVSLNDVTAALAAMTVHGMSADQASQDVAHSIQKMQSPTQAMTKYLAQIGITSADLADKLGQKGITGTLQDISQAIMSKMGPSGRVLIDSFNQSKSAAEDANKMIAAMPTHLQTLAKQFQNGQVTAGDFRKEIKALPVDQANLMTQFSSLQNSASGFNSLLKSGSPEAKTYAAALYAATGDATTLNTALMLTGENTAYVNKAVKDVSGATVEAGGNVRGWSEVQGTFNNKLQRLQQLAATSGIALGTALLPAATAVIDGMIHFNEATASAVDWMSKHHTAVIAAASVLTVLFGPALAGVAIMATVVGVKAVASAVKTGAAWVLNAAKASLAWELQMAKLVVSGATTAAKSTAQAVVVSAKWVAQAAVASTAWVVNELPKIVAAGAVTATKSAIHAADTSLAWVLNAARVSFVWVTQEMPKLAASFIRTSASATKEAVVSSGAWIASAAKTSASWVVTELPKIVASFIVTSGSAAKEAVVSSGVWIASAAKSSFAWVVTEMPKIITAFIAASGSAIAQAAVSSGAWVAAAVTSSASYEAFAALVATPLVMPAIVVAAALAAIALVLKAVQEVTGAINAMNDLKSAQSSNEQVSQDLVKSAKSGLAAGRITQAQYDKDITLARKKAPDVGWFDKLLTGKLALGTNFATGGRTLVGENGPEIVDMPHGSRVTPTRESQKLMGGGGASININNLNINNNMDEQKFLKSLGWKLSL